MVILRNKRFVPITITILAIIATGFLVSTTANAYYLCHVGDEACEEARNNLQANRNEEAFYQNKANTVAGIIEQLNAEINALNAEIAQNEADVEALNIKITEIEEKLRRYQDVIASMLIDAHFNNNSDPINILAGSSSLSELTDKKVREEVAKNEIQNAVVRIRETKRELELARGEVEIKIALNEENKKQIDFKKAEQQKLLSEYNDSANDAASAANYWKNELSRLAFVPQANTVGFGYRNWSATNTYADRFDCPQSNMDYETWYGGLVCQCTSYVSWKAYEKWGIVNDWRGHAYAYVNAGGRYVPNTGDYTYVDNIAEPYTIAIQPASSDAIYGHVMWVESVNEDGTINVTEYNVYWPKGGCYDGGFCSRNSVGTAGLSFLHFKKEEYF